MNTVTMEEPSDMLFIPTIGDKITERGWMNLYLRDPDSFHKYGYPQCDSSIYTYKDRKRIEIRIEHRLLCEW